jgi:hypothetical protein
MAVDFAMAEHELMAEQIVVFGIVERRSHQTTDNRWSQIGV